MIHSFYQNYAIQSGLKISNRYCLSIVVSSILIIDTFKNANFYLLIYIDKEDNSDFTI